ncbi:hypothetical protein ACFFUB_13320 [Algimonas porphyrae]|uniref:Uncharacterized protein n=1 Tax=Algimonas porphyrae TaxID=1128113 RepID=A0ABQ5UVW0_9PROT|nr:hypothetical protein [Algimonas porphyrae]GLQ19398.1 hypothetical protein GCM10007854_03530 [Algimonas porphyrae]
MLLRRIAEHLEEQNWTAVLLDLLIVVFGVFLGIQFANWNSVRADSRAERAILERLQADVAQMQAADLAATELFLQYRLSNLLSARRVIFGIEDRAELTHDECQAIGFSHYPLVGVGGLPILEELKATGQMGLIRDPDIVRAISKLTELWETGRVIDESNRGKITLLSRAFPDMIVMDLDSGKTTLSDFEIDPYDPVYLCDTAAMGADTAFKNAFGENVTLQFSLLEISIEPLRQSLKDLSAALQQGQE